MWKTFGVSNGAQPQHWINRTFMAPQSRCGKLLKAAKTLLNSTRRRRRLSRACPSCFQRNVILNSCFVVTAGDIFQVDSIPPLFLSCGAFEYQWPMCRRGFPCSDSPNSNLEYQCSWPELSRFHCSCFSFSFSHKKSKWHEWCGKSLDRRIEGPRGWRIGKRVELESW